MNDLIWTYTVSWYSTEYVVFPVELSANRKLGISCGIFSTRFGGIFCGISRTSVCAAKCGVRKFHRICHRTRTYSGDFLGNFKKIICSASSIHANRISTFSALYCSLLFPRCYKHLSTPLCVLRCVAASYLLTFPPFVVVWCGAVWKYLGFNAASWFGVCCLVDRCLRVAWIPSPGIKEARSVSAIKPSSMVSANSDINSLLPSFPQFNL